VQGFWFFENILDQNTSANSVWWFQSPRGDFGFLKSVDTPSRGFSLRHIVSIPSRGFWFFEGTSSGRISEIWRGTGFNPLAGILVF